MTHREALAETARLAGVDEARGDALDWQAACDRRFTEMAKSLVLTSADLSDWNLWFAAGWFAHRAPVGEGEEYLATHLRRNRRIYGARQEHRGRDRSGV